MTSETTIPLTDVLASGTDSPVRTVSIHTHGCKLNQSDSQTLTRQFVEAGVPGGWSI